MAIKVVLIFLTNVKALTTIILQFPLCVYVLVGENIANFTNTFTIFYHKGRGWENITLELAISQYAISTLRVNLSSTAVLTLSGVTSFLSVLKKLNQCHI